MFILKFIGYLYKQNRQLYPKDGWLVVKPPQLRPFRPCQRADVRRTKLLQGWNPIPGAVISVTADCIKATSALLEPVRWPHFTNIVQSFLDFVAQNFSYSYNKSGLFGFGRVPAFIFDPSPGLQMSLTHPFWLESLARHSPRVPGLRSTCSLAAAALRTWPLAIQNGKLPFGNQWPAKWEIPEPNGASNGKIHRQIWRGHGGSNHGIVC